MSTGLEWTCLSENWSTVRYKIGTVDDRDSRFFFFIFFFFLFLLAIICLYVCMWVFVLFCHHRGRGLKWQSEASSNTAGYMMDIPKVSIAEYKLMRRQKLLISCRRDLSGNRCYRKMMIVRSAIRNVYVVIWINPSITCLAPETFVHKRVHINHWDYKNISSYVIILYILYIYILTKNIKQ